jgi:hypothetical protein
MKFCKNIFFILLLSSISLPLRGRGGLHAFHTSLTQIEYNSKEKSLEISIRVFTDDFETALTKFNSGKKVAITADNKNDVLISKYIQQHFAFISPQKQPKNYNFIGKEIEEQATWIYVELPDYLPVGRQGQPLSNGISLQNNILIELFDDQTNLVNFTVLANKKTFIFNSKKTIFDIAF